MNKMSLELLRKFVTFKVLNVTMYADYNIHGELPGFRNYQELALRLFDNVYSEENINKIINDRPFWFKCIKSVMRENGVRRTELEYFYAIDSQDGVRITTTFDKRLFILKTIDDFTKILDEMGFGYIKDDNVVPLGHRFYVDRSEW